MKTLTALLLLSLLAFASADVSAQQVIKIGGKIYKIASVRSDTLERNFESKYIGSIKQSKYELEIRCTVVDVLHINKPVVMIKGNKDSLFAESYLLRFEEPKTANSDNAATHINKVPKIIRTRLTRTKYVDSMLTKLIASNVFGTKDTKLIEDSLKAIAASHYPTQHPLDGPPFDKIEIKLNGKYHSYFSGEPKEKYKSVIKEFATGEALRDLFRELYEEIEKTGTVVIK